MARVTPDCIRRIRESVDIVGLIQEVLPLTKAGSYFKCSCPFHQDKTPSLMVSPTRQTWKCYSCGQGGSSIDFLMAYEKLEFMEAITRLAERGSITIEYEGGQVMDAHAAKRMKDWRSRLMEVMEWAQRFFARNLFQKGPGPEEALAYLRKRGLDDAAIREWGIGYSPDSFDTTLLAGMKQFGDAKLLDECGITRVNENDRRFDFFRHRIMFPIRDRQGRVVAFGARKLREDDMGGKYINSPATPIYDKGKVLYGLDRLPRSSFNRARNAQSRIVLVVEGYMDAIACHRAGVDCAVAPCGTAITPEQLRTLSPYANRLVLLMDGDAAGQASMERVAAEVVAQGLNVLAAQLPEGKDPDEFLRTHSVGELEDALAKGRDLFAFKLQALARRYDLTNPVEKRKAVGEALEVISAAQDVMLRDELARRTGEQFGVPESLIHQTLKGLRQPRRHDETSAARPADMGIVPVAERTMLVRFLTHPELIRPVSEYLHPEDFDSPSAAEVLRTLLNIHDEFGPEAIDERGHIKGALLLDHLGSDYPGARALMMDLLEGEVSAASFGTPQVEYGKVDAFDLGRAVNEIRMWLDRKRRRATPMDGGRAGVGEHKAVLSRLEEMRLRNRR